MGMKLALNQWSLWRDLDAGRLTIADLIRGAATRGFHSIELLDWHFNESPADVQRIRELCDELGLTVCAFGIRNDFATPDFAQQIQQGKRLKQGLDTAQLLGAKILRVFGGRPSEGINFDAALGRMIEALQMALDWARTRRVKIALENFGQLSGRSDQILELIHAIEHSSFGLTADVGNFLLVDENPVDALRKLGKHLFHIHINDFIEATDADTEGVLISTSGKRYVGTELGKGVVDVGAVLALLEKIDYEGYVSLEYQGSLDGWEGVDLSLKSLSSHFDTKA